MKKLLLVLIVALMSSCTFKEYKPFDNAIQAMEAKESTEKLKKEVDQWTKEKLSAIDGKEVEGE